ncbi:hypothetical protein [Chitinophaga sp. LS1]|uniref:AbiU2 domain-containing protein n=1 Tax=Chitinophaga sp. LS1 TaxID=3051176 RepID=UPI002AAB5863|nr:hypothetical protein [Chitinophaga sp. LS1]WPV65407.1 hypothetical protein QQL36_26760 [Chitinophaga sp. LS1]
MKGKKQQELKNEIWQICEILLLAKSSFNITKYLLHPNSLKHTEYINSSAYFKYSIIINWRTTVIELSKLFADNKDRDRFNLKHFIKKLKKDGHFGDIKIPDTIIADWEAILDKEVNAINNLILQRDKIYAHTDPAHKSVTNTVHIRKTDELIGVVEKVIKHIYLTVFDTGISFEPVGDPIQNLNYLLDILVNERETNLAPPMAFAKKHGLEDV